MAYDPGMVERIRQILASVDDVKEMKLFGGIGWTVGGNMATGAYFDGRLVVRCSREDFATFVADPGADAMKRGERSLFGWILVDADAVADDADLARWVGRGRAYAESLPKKG